MLKKIKKIVYIRAVVLLIVIVALILFDNTRIKVIKDDIAISELSETFDGYKILQISDLHSKEFGKEQKRLVNKINSEDYDAIVFTGDIIDSGKYDLKPFTDIINNIENKENMYYVIGNSDLFIYDPLTLEKSEYAKKLELLGVNILTGVTTINKGNDRLIISNYETVRKIDAVIETYNANEAKNCMSIKEGLEHLDIKEEDTVIGIGHYPIYEERLKMFSEDNPLGYDLLLSGHFHGGQVRIPFYGALYVPDSSSETNGFFPNQEHVSYLQTFNNVNQYISRGLGASSIFKVRIFNPPEINVLTLKKK